LHLFNRPSVGRSVIRLKSSGADLSSNRVRTPRETKALREHGAAIRIYQLQGHLTFSTTEPLVKDVIDLPGATSFLALDFRRALTINEAACRFLHRLLEKERQRCAQMVFAHADHLPLLRRYMKAKLGSEFDAAYRAFEDMDVALEWCENQLLAKVVPGWDSGAQAGPSEYELFKGLSPAQIESVVPRLQRKHYQPGEVIIHVGDKAEHLYFLARGSVSVLVTGQSGSMRRLATFSAGMTFGEMAVLDRAPRSARIVADTEVECDLLGVEEFDRLNQTDPAIKIAVLENLGVALCSRLRAANRQAGALG
jgi:glutaminase